MSNAAHEALRAPDTIALPSNRSFGLIFVVVFLVIALWPLAFSGTLRWWSLWVAAGFALVTLVTPSLLTRPNRLWMQFGAVLHRVVSPVVLGLMFFVAITPFALVMRWVGRDALGLKFDRNAKSYWIRREPPGPAPDSLDKQY